MDFWWDEGLIFWIVRWVKVAWLVGLSDMGYDKWFEMGKLGFCLILVGFLKISTR